MPRHTLTLTLIAAFAVSALAAPAALARPTDSLSPQARNAAATAAANAGRTAYRTCAGSARGHIPSDDRSLTTARRPSQSSTPRTPPAAQQPARTVSTDDGAPWTLIALGLGGAFLLIAMLAVARRARLRTHIAA